MAVFKTRARALDMLGRQQIAGIPTAISELFKNAHDAYADRVEGDFYRYSSLLVLRDDGVGMTKTDFENRWLTLATESKVGTRLGMLPPLVAAGKELRPVMGEKGIGRLAIGVISPQLLILTRAVQGAERSDLVAAFLNWKIFEIPGIDLNEIEIPVFTFPGGTVPSQADVAEMVAVFRQNLTRLGDAVSATQYKDISADLDRFDIAPEQIDGYVKQMSLQGDGHGTHFYLLPVYDTLAADIDGNSNDDAAPPLQQMLIGFANTMTPSHAPPRIQTSFRDHKTVEVYEDLIAEREFFTPEEFSLADHHIQGRFDEYGQFTGMVQVYGEEAVDHVVAWTDARGRQTECGPFKLNLAYVQGEAKATIILREDYTKIIQKLNRLGGLYIYKDGIRVLPYGSADYDFLQLERNRSKKADYYFFSYRRMFGVVEITQVENLNLSEKAGREGFRENKAYRQFKDILTQFFIQIAQDFFRPGGVHTEVYAEKKAELERQDAARRRRDGQVNQKRRVLADSLNKFFESVNDTGPVREVETLLSELDKELAAAVADSDREQAANAFLDAEAHARQRLQRIKSAYNITKPRGIGLSRVLGRKWEDYQNEFGRLNTEIFAPAAKRIEETAGQLAQQAQLEVDRRRRIERSLQDMISQATRNVSTQGRETQKTIDAVKNQIFELTRESVADVNHTTKQVLSRFARMDMSRMDDEAIVAERETLENEITGVEERNKKLLEDVREQLSALNLVPDEQRRLLSSVDDTEDLEQRLIASEERADLDLELTQLGMAIQVINHEFDSTVKSVRQNLQRLKAWADLNTGLKELYTNIRASFDHLDSYLTLFTPLNRRLYRSKVEITGAEIGKFLEDLFKERLARHNVILRQSPAFRRMKIVGYPSSFYPVFVNLIDNSLFWLQDRSGLREINLDADGSAFIIADTGSGVSVHDRERIFEFGFTRKPGGRGMGLHVSRQTLEKEGYTLSRAPATTGQGATFRIEPKMDDADKRNAEDNDDSNDL